MSAPAILLRIFADVWAGLLNTFRRHEPLIQILASPLWVLGIALFLASNNLGYLRDPVTRPLVLGGLCWGAVTFMMISDKLWIIGHRLEREKRTGVLEQVAASGQSMALHAASTVAVAMAWTLPSTLLALATVFPALGVSPLPRDPALFAFGYLLLELSTSGVSMIYSCFAASLRRPWVATNVVQFTIPVFSGIVPYLYAPEPLKPLILWSPISYPVELLRMGAMGFEGVPLAVQDLVAISAASSAALWILGAGLVELLFKRARRVPI